MNTQLTKLIKVKDDTYERLSERGKKNDTYDDIIRNLLDLTESKSRKWRVNYFIFHLVIIISLLLKGLREEGLFFIPICRLNRL